MTSLAQVPLGEICEINPRAKRDGYASDTLVSFVPMAAVDERLGAITSREDRPIADVSKGYTPFEDGDVLFAKITPCMENGKAALARNLTNGMGSGSTEFYVLRPGERVLGEYIYHFVRQSGFRETAKRNFTGTAGQQRVPRSFMENVSIPLPALDEQRRIVGILNRAAKIERLRAQAADRLREFIPALFVRMFGDPGENPHGHRKQMLAECANFISGATPSKKNEAYWDGEIPWISAKDMKVDLISDSEDHVSDVAFAETSLKAVPTSTPIIVVRGMILAHTVPIALTARTVAINQDMKAIDFDSAIDPVFGFWCLKVLQQRILDDVDTAAHGTKRIEMSRLGAIPMHIPSEDLQRRFAQLVQRARSIFALADAGSNSVSGLTACLMSRLLEAAE
ncbi:MAG: restriction endonuclease subunit S [Defluviicoccus sp.]|nr:restriction endonuclease subunit S [Defluviicoccus sp.]MDE0274606.1 restriction endonuclease subunit S [Defluviicoccus sp.]